MRLTVDKVRVPSNPRARYYTLEPDGRLTGHGYFQRPAAMRMARACANVNGTGLYDVRERKILVDPDPTRRVESLRAMAADLEADARKLRERSREIEVYEEWNGAEGSS